MIRIIPMESNCHTKAISTTSYIKVNSHSKLYHFVNIILMIGLIANTAMPYFYRPIETVVLGFLLVVFVQAKRKIKIMSTKHILFFVLSVFVIYLFKLASGRISSFVFMGFFLRIYYAIAIVHIFKTDFIRYFVLAMRWICISSLIFYVPYLLAPNTMQSIYEGLSLLTIRYFPFSQGGVYFTSTNFLFYEFGAMPAFRNAGPFWEAGVLAGFSLIALYLNYISDRYPSRLNTFLFIVCTISTLATTGYLALSFLVLAYFIIVKRNFKTIMIFLPAFALICYFAFTNVYFLQEKITSHSIEITRNDNIDTSTRKTRFVSFILDFNDALESPLIGCYKPEREITIKMNSSGIDLEKHRNNGIGQLFKKYGFIFTFYYFYLLFKSFRRVCFHKNKLMIATIGCVLIIILGFSEPYFGLIFFWCLPFLHLYSDKTISHS